LNKIEIVESDNCRFPLPQVIYSSSELLTKIIMGGNAFSFESISYFFHKNNSYNYVEFIHVPCLSIPLINYIINVCIELKYISFKACVNITKESIYSFKKCVRSTVDVYIIEI
jgi:hypothetical protein